MRTKSRRPTTPRPTRRSKTRPTWKPLDQESALQALEASVLRPVEDDASDGPPPSREFTNKERAFLAERIAVRDRETAALTQKLRPYRRGGAPGRRDALAQILDEILDRAPRSKLPAVWDWLRELEGTRGSAIVSVYKSCRTGYVRWRSGSGELRRTTAHRIGNRLAGLRRRPGRS